MNALSIALAKHVGQVLSPALAGAIAREVSPPKPFLPSRWAHETFEGYAIQCEMLACVPDDLKAQRESYLAETNPGEPCNRTNWDALIEMQRLGHHVIFTARQGHLGPIVASVWLYVDQNIDTGAMRAVDDMLFCNPDHRGGMLVVRLLQYAEEAMFGVGVRECVIHARLANGVERMTRLMGYSPVATRVFKAHHGDSFADVKSQYARTP